MSDNDFANRTNDPVRVFMDSSNAYRPSRGLYEFYLSLESYYEHYDIYFQVRKIQCTYSWNNIEEGNNKLSFNNNETVVVVPEGNYSLTGLLDYLNTNVDGY